MNKLALGLALICVCLLSWPGAALAEEPTPAHTAWLPLVLKSCCSSEATTTPTPTPTAAATTTPTAAVRIAPEHSQWDAPGNDNDNLNEEYVCLENVGAAAADMIGWHLRDAANYAYTFPAFTLAAAARVWVRTGAGTDTATDLYWGRGQAVWTNDGDTAYLYDAAWGLVDQYTYPASISSGGESLWPVATFP